MKSIAKQDKIADVLVGQCSCSAPKKTDIAPFALELSLSFIHFNTIKPIC